MKNRLIKIVVGACFILALGVAVASFICNDDFWKVNAAQALTLIVTICIAFWATQLKNDERKKNHSILADDLEMVLNGPKRFFRRSVSTFSSTIPTADRNAAA